MLFDVASYNGMFGGVNVSGVWAWGVCLCVLGVDWCGLTWQDHISQRGPRARRWAAPDRALQGGLV